MSRQLPEKAGDEYFMRRGEECGSGRSTGTPATRSGYSDWRNDRFLVDDGYRSKWRKRKDRRMKNLYDLENNISTPATDMMRKRNITGSKPHFEQQPYVKKKVPITPGEKRNKFSDVYFGRAAVYDDNGKVTEKPIKSWLNNYENISFGDYLKQINYTMPYGFRTNWC